VPNADSTRQFESGLEPAPQDFPEVTQEQQGYGHHQLPYPQHQQQSYPHEQEQPYLQHQQQPYYQQAYDPSATTPKPEHTAAPSTYGGQTVSSPYSPPAQPAATQPETKTIAVRTICGCSLLVFILSCMVALLSAAVIGLAAATGIESQRASSAASSLAALTASATTTSSGPSATGVVISLIDDGCSTNASAVNKTLYTSFSRTSSLSIAISPPSPSPNPD
jgi:hypothetical protein